MAKFPLKRNRFKADRLHARRDFTDEVRVAAAKARVAADKLDNSPTPDWIIELSEMEQVDESKAVAR